MAEPYDNTSYAYKGGPCSSPTKQQPYDLEMVQNKADNKSYRMALKTVSLENLSSRGLTLCLYQFRTKALQKKIQDTLTTQKVKANSSVIVTSEGE